MHGIMIFPRDNHYQPTIAMWTRNLCTFTGSLMEKSDKASFDMTYSYGLSIHIDFIARVRLEGGLYMHMNKCYEMYLC